MTTTDTRTDLYAVHFTDAEDDDRSVAERLADMTAIAKMLHTRAEHLTTALDSNRDIGVAVGLIMAQYKLGHQAAFDVLIKLSQNTNCKLRDLAGQIILAEDADYLSRRDHRSSNWRGTRAPDAGPAGGLTSE